MYVEHRYSSLSVKKKAPFLKGVGVLPMFAHNNNDIFVLVLLLLFLAPFLVKIYDNMKEFPYKKICTEFFLKNRNKD